MQTRIIIIFVQNVYKHCLQFCNIDKSVIVCIDAKEFFKIKNK